MSSGFGFADIKPSTAAPRTTSKEIAETDKVGEAYGFVSRQALPTIRRKVKNGPDGPVGQFNLRATVADVNEFVEWCGQERMSYREGFSKLMELKRNL